MDTATDLQAEWEQVEVDRVEDIATINTAITIALPGASAGFRSLALKLYSYLQNKDEMKATEKNETKNKTNQNNWTQLKTNLIW